MENIEPADKHRINAALGWLELDNPREAAEELRHLSPGTGNSPEVTEIWWMIHAQSKEWELALVAAQLLTVLAPDDHTGWIHQSYSLHELKRTQEAWDQLLPAAGRFPREGIIPYNLACYACQLGQMERALMWLSRAMELEGAGKVKERAFADADLAPLKREIEKL